MKFNFLFLTVFSFSVFTYANTGCVDAISASEQATIVQTVNAAAANSKVLEIRSLTAGKCINGDQMLELLGLVESNEDKLVVFEILANKLIETNHRAEYKRVKSTFLN